MRKFLILTADDFGLHPDINAAVEQASRTGVLTAASLMVGAPAAADAVRRARALPELKVGLHLVLADGASVLPAQQIPALVDAAGRFRDRLFVDALRYVALPRVRRQLEAEIRAQFAAFAATGLVLDHVNAHKHLHLHPAVLDLMLEVGAEFGRPAIRVPDEPWQTAWRSGAGFAGMPATAAALALEPWVSLMKRRLRAAGIAHNDQVFGIARSGSMDEPALLDALAHLPEGVSEIYLHPAVRSGPAIAPSMAAYRHADEFAALLSPRVRAAIVAAKVEVGGYRDLIERPCT